VKRNFAATEVDRVWVADITYVATAEGFLYLAFILDVHTRRIVGWAMKSHLRTESLWSTPSRWPCGEGNLLLVWCIIFRPGGPQYTALSFSERLREVGITPSMGRTGSALDNALAESFVSRVEGGVGEQALDFQRNRPRREPSSSTWKRSTTPAVCTHLWAR
jgi:putative transposase